MSWHGLGNLPLSSKTVLFLRSVAFGCERGLGKLDTRHLVLDNCEPDEAWMSDILNRFPHLETLLFFETDIDDLVSTLVALPTSIRCVHILDPVLRLGEDPPDSRHVLPHLESFTYMPLYSRASESQLPADDEAKTDALAEVQQAVELTIDAPQCTFKYVRPSTESPEEALAKALATFNL